MAVGGPIGRKSWHGAAAAAGGGGSMAEALHAPVVHARRPRAPTAVGLIVHDRLILADGPIKALRYSGNGGLEDGAAFARLLDRAALY